MTSWEGGGVGRFDVRGLLVLSHQCVHFGAAFAVFIYGLISMNPTNNHSAPKSKEP